MNARINPVGISCHLSSLDQTAIKNQLSLMQQAGINWARFDFFWIQMEPTQGNYDFSTYDYILQQAALVNIQLIPLLTQYNIPKFYRINTTNNRSTPKDYPGYASYHAFCQAVAAHYAGQILLYELGNEPDLDKNWPSNIPPAQSFTNFLSAGYQGIKAGDSGAKVISGGLSNVNSSAFFQAMYQYGVKGYFDYFGFHPYCYPRSPDDTLNATAFSNLNTMGQVMVNNTDVKPIIASEIGWPTALGGVDQKTQAAYIQRVFQKIEYEDYQFVPIVCVYDFIDDGSSPKNNEDNFGLITYKNVPKISFSTVQQVRQNYNINFTPINP